VGERLRASSVQLITSRLGTHRRTIRDLPNRPDTGARLVRSPRAVRNHRGSDDNLRLAPAATASTSRPRINYVSAHTRIASICRSTGVVARYGGEEFVVLLPDTDEQRAQQIAGRIRIEIRKSPVVDAATQIPVCASVGVATHRDGDMRLLIEPRTRRRPRAATASPSSRRRASDQPASTRAAANRSQVRAASDGALLRAALFSTRWSRPTGSPPAVSGSAWSRGLCSSAWRWRWAAGPAPGRPAGSRCGPDDPAACDPRDDVARTAAGQRGKGIRVDPASLAGRTHVRVVDAP
jgi:hypothetical protein